jgi:hypothetical protein
MGRAACELCEAENDFDEFCVKIRSSVKDITGEDVDASSQSSPITCEVCDHYSCQLVCDWWSTTNEWDKCLGLIILRTWSMIMKCVWI